MRSFTASRWRRAKDQALLELRRGRYSLGLLLERRLALFAVLDGLVVLFGAFQALLGDAQLASIYNWTAVLLIVVLGPLVLSSVIALERRAGSLDLALAVPSTERYFLRRLVPVMALLVIQSWGLVLLALPFLRVRMDFGKYDALVRSLVQSALIGALVVCVVLFWASRLRTAGGVLVATWVTLGALGPWLFESAFDDRKTVRWGFERILGVPMPLLEWIGCMMVLALAATIFYLYARQRLRRPQSLLD